MGIAEAEERNSWHVLDVSITRKSRCVPPISALSHNIYTNTSDLHRRLVPGNQNLRFVSQD